MAMNKAEKAAFEKLENDLRLARAFKFTDKLEPDVPSCDAITKGFLFNAYNKRVSHAISRWGSHKTSDVPITETAGYSWSQGGKNLYSTKLLALKAMRHEVELECAATLAKIDFQIEQENR